MKKIILKIFKKNFFFYLGFVILFSEKLMGQDNDLLDNPSSVQQNDIIKYIDDFIDLPPGGIPWETFGETIMDEYTIVDSEGNDWVGVRPKFKEKIKKLESKNILVQGYMFPLEQDEKQSLFLLGPFPLSCPYHPHVSSNLLIEVHTKNPITFSYDAVNIKGELELVSKDDDYNIFFRLNNAELHTSQKF